MAKRKKVYLVTIKLAYNENDLRKAKIWSNKQGYTYTRNEGYAPMLFAAEVAGIVYGNLMGTDLVEY